MMKRLTAQIASLPDRENVVFEIYYDADQVAEISKEPSERLRIDIFSCPADGIWSFELEEFCLLIEQAKRNLP